MMANKIKPFTTHTLPVKWAHLHKADTKFGDDSANHSCTVIVDEQLQKQLDQMLSESGAIKINGMNTNDETSETYLKAKSKIFVKRGRETFPCRDAGAQPTEAVAFGGDSVRLRLSPAVLSRDNSMSLYLNGVQIIEKGSDDGDSGGFEATEGFDGSSFKSPEADETSEEMDEIPF
jgi:hypothetical protein